jgi:hypothetical protein
MNAVGQFVAQNSLAGNTRGLKVVDLQIIDIARGGSVMAMPIDRVAPEAIRPTASAGVVSFDR